MTEQQSKLQPDLSIVLVSDYAAGTEKGCNDLRNTLEALTDELHGTSNNIECLLIGEAKHDGAIPQDLIAMVPNLTVALVTVHTSYEMKNAGMEAAKADWVTLLDADCQPHQGWLEAMLASIARTPDAAAISGRTLYEGRSILERLSALVQRSYLDPGEGGRTHFISNNNAVWRREWFLKFPLPVGLGPFSSRLQSEQMLRAGAKLWFEPRMRVIHQFEGMSMDADIFKNMGYGTVVSRYADPKMPHAWIVRLGPVAIPAIVLGKTWLRLCDVVRCAHAYGIRWFEIPLAWGYAIMGGIMEIPGMWAAYRNAGLGETAYR